MVCVKKKRGPKGSRESDINHTNATKAISQNFGSANNFVPKNSEVESKSTKYTNIQSKYVGKLDKIKLLEACIMAYDMRDPFIIPALLDGYIGSVKDRWGNCVATEVYLLYHY